MTRTATLPRVDRLPAVGLDELAGSSALMTRVDRKYLLRAAEAAVVLELAPEDTRVLEIDGRRSFGYTTTYLDTPGLLTYHLAAHRRRRRFKVRTRTYEATGASYLEVKTRSVDRTVKTRLRGDHLTGGRLDLEGTRFVTERLEAAGIASTDVPLLEVTLTIHYHRTTLRVADGARVTIDRGLRWDRPDGALLSLPDLAVFETKSSGHPTSLDRLLWSLGHRPRRISKYATGSAALDPDLPANRWARTLRDHF